MAVKALEWASSIETVAKAVGCSTTAIKRGMRAGRIKKTGKGFHVDTVRAVIEFQRSRGKNGTIAAAGNGATDPYSELVEKNANQREELFEWDKRGRRAKALIAEVELAEKSKRVMPIVQTRKAWIANEMLWKENLRTIARQLGAMWGGKLGREIEVAANKLFDEMFQRMVGDPMLRGEARAMSSTH